MCFNPPFSQNVKTKIGEKFLILVEKCPLNGNCLVVKLVYKAIVRDENNTVQTYTGLTANKFKDRFYGHTQC